MALRRQNLSPAANLLRNSRLFALPNPLPRASASATSGTAPARASDSATLPYPTHQAIATTKSSLSRGDWGLKRAIPSKSRTVQISNPVINVTQLDSIELITDYESAADHVRTREKWEELDIPIMRGMQAMRDTAVVIPPTNAFDRRSDITSYETPEGYDEAAAMLANIRQGIKHNKREQRLAKEAKAKDPNAPDALFVPHTAPEPDPVRRNIRRWKHEGPWLPAMSSNEFLNYINKQLAARKEEFQSYLEQEVKNQIYTRRANDFRLKETLPLDQDEAEKVQRQNQRQWSQFTPEEIQAEIKNMRQAAASDPLESKLFTNLIAPFLQLPSFKSKDISRSENATRHAEQHIFDDSAVPLSTHPSAGLGYQQTNTSMMNHPILGPQRQKQPVTARVLQPRNLPMTTERRARLGVGGFVTNDSEAAANSRTKFSRFDNKDPINDFDEITPGGAKVEVIAQFGSVSTDGRIFMKVERTHGAEIMVKQGELVDRPPVKQQNRSNSDFLASLTKPGTTLGADSPQVHNLQGMIQQAEQQRNAENGADAGAGAPTQRPQRARPVAPSYGKFTINRQPRGGA